MSKVTLDDSFLELRTGKEKKKWLQLWAWQEVWNDKYAQDPIIKDLLKIDSELDDIDKQIEALEETKRELRWEREELLLRASELYPREKGYKNFIYWSFGGTVIKASEVDPITVLFPVVCEKCGQVSQISHIYESRNTLMYATGKHWFSSFECDSCRKKQQLVYQRYSEKRTARLQELKSMPYQEYLQTEEWQETRKKALKRAGFKCQLCNSGGKLNVHHRTYERRGDEDYEDLIVLCANCHAKHHNKSRDYSITTKFTPEEIELFKL